MECTGISWVFKTWLLLTEICSEILLTVLELLELHIHTLYTNLYLHSYGYRPYEYSEYKLAYNKDINLVIDDYGHSGWLYEHGV